MLLRCSLIWDILMIHTHFYICRASILWMWHYSLSISIWKVVWNFFQIFTITSSATPSTFVFLQNMFLDFELLIERIGHLIILTGNAKLPNKKAVSQVMLAKDCYHIFLPALDIISPKLCQSWGRKKRIGRERRK